MAKASNFLMKKVILHATTVRITVLGDPKYGLGSEPHWKAGSARYPDFYRALLDEPSRTNRIEMMRARTFE